MNAELIAYIDHLERDKGINRSVVLEALQTALLSASRRSVGPAREMRIEIDPKTGEIRALANLIVSDPVLNEHDQISLAKALRIKKDAQIGDDLEVEVTPKNF